MLCEISHLGTGSGIPSYQDSQGFPRTTTWRICPPIDLGIWLSWCLACWRSWWLMCSALHLAPDGANSRWLALRAARWSLGKKEPHVTIMVADQLSGESCRGGPRNLDRISIPVQVCRTGNLFVLRCKPR
jgi:hypothetical protein